MPLGDAGMTMLTLLVSYPQIHWVFTHHLKDKKGTLNEFVLDDEEIKSALGDVSLTEPEVLRILRGMIEEGIAALAPQTEF